MRILPAATTALLMVSLLVPVATNNALAQAKAGESTPAAAVDDTAAALKRIQETQRALDAKLTDIQKRLDAISTFLGSDRASSFDSVDRRLRDIETAVDDIKREVRRR